MESARATTGRRDDGLCDRTELTRRARALLEEEIRVRGAIACVVLTVRCDRGQPDDVVRRCERTLRTARRGADAIGRIGPTEFAVVAPSTDASGAVGLAERLGGVLRTELEGAGFGAVMIVAGYDAPANLHAAPIEPETLLLRAATATAMGLAEQGRRWIRRFSDALDPTALMRAPATSSFSAA